MPRDMVMNYFSPVPESRFLLSIKFLFVCFLLLFFKICLILLGLNCLQVFGNMLKCL